MEHLASLFNAVVAHFMAQPWAQTVGLVALLIGATAFGQKDDRKLKINLTVFNIFMGFHFMLLGVWTGAWTAWLSSVRTYLSSRTRHLWVMFFFLVLVWVLGLPNVEEPAHLLPLVGTTLGTWALFRESGLRMRVLMFAGSICWVTHNFWVGSIGGTVIESLFMVINIRTMLLLIRQPRVPASERT